MTQHQKLGLVFALFTLPASAGDLLERAHLDGVRRERGKPPVYLASLTPARYFAAPAFAPFQVVPLGGGGGGALVPGSTTLPACTANSFLYADGSKVVQCNGPTYDNSGAGNGTFALAKTPSGASLTSNFLNVTGTLPTSPSQVTTGILESITAAASGQLLYGHQTTITAASSAISNGSAAGGFHNSIISTAGIGDPIQAATFADAQAGIYASSTGVDNKGHIGVRGYTSGNGASTKNYGVVGYASNSAGALNIGVLGAVNTATTTNFIGVAGILGTASPTWANAAGLFDNGSVAADILCGRDNGTSVWCLNDGGAVSTGTGQFTKEFSGNKLNITEAAPQAVIRIALATSASYGAWVTYTVRDSDGTDFVVRNGSIQVQGANKAGTAVCTILSTRDQETEDGSSAVVTGGALTLTYTWTNVVSTVNCDLSINAASNAGANTLDIYWKAIVTTDSTATAIAAQ